MVNYFFTYCLGRRAMTERLKQEFGADPNNELTIKVFERVGIRGKLEALLPDRTVDVPSGMFAHYYEAVPMKIRRNERVEVVNQSGEVIMRP